MLEGRLERARRAVRTRSRSTKYTEQDYGNIATTHFSYFIIVTRNYWHALIFATVRTWKISKIPPKSARIELPGHIKISILTKCCVRVVYPETVTYGEALRALCSRPWWVASCRVTYHRRGDMRGLQTSATLNFNWVVSILTSCHASLHGACNILMNNAYIVAASFNIDTLATLII